jgi:hypothetical protein
MEEIGRKFLGGTALGLFVRKRRMLLDIKSNLGTGHSKSRSNYYPDIYTV